MSKTARTALLAIAALSVAACGSDTTETGETGVGGANTKNTSNDSTPGSGGASQESAKSTTKGGSSQKSSRVGTDGGETSSTDQGSSEGGASSTEQENSAGGASSTTNKPSTGGTNATTNGRATGGASSASSTAAGSLPATGGASSTGGRSSRNPRGSGGASSSGGAATGGSQGPSTTATGGAAPGTTATGGATNTSNLEKFSFFVTSYAALKRLSGNELGFGGDLRYGESTGLAGADKLCTEIAEKSMTGAGTKGWRAFLSTSSVDAIDRITYDGPFYDRRGRVVATNKAGLTSGERPAGADSSIVSDLPNEDGIANHAADGTKVDNHDVLTGSTSKGMKTGDSCSDWTNATSSGKIQIGHSWPAHGNGWLFAHTVNGCKPGVTFLTNPNAESGASGTVGSMGGYGGFYCLALQP